MDRTYENSMAKAFAKLLREEGVIPSSVFAERTRNSHYIGIPYVKAIKDASKYYPFALHDKYKHAMVNCLSAQEGTAKAIEADNLSRLKEFYDILLKKNTPEESSEDMYANKIGRYLGYKYPQGDCDELVQRYIKKIY